MPATFGRSASGNVISQSGRCTSHRPNTIRERQSGRRVERCFQGGCRQPAKPDRCKARVCAACAPTVVRPGRRRKPDPTGAQLTQKPETPRHSEPPESLSFGTKTCFTVSVLDRSLLPAVSGTHSRGFGHKSSTRRRQSELGTYSESTPRQQQHSSVAVGTEEPVVVVVLLLLLQLPCGR